MKEYGALVIFSMAQSLMPILSKKKKMRKILLFLFFCIVIG